VYKLRRRVSSIVVGRRLPSRVSGVCDYDRECARYGVTTLDSYESVAKFHVAVESELSAERPATAAAAERYDRELCRGGGCGRGGGRRCGECRDREWHTGEREHGECRNAEPQTGSGG